MQGIPNLRGSWTKASDHSVECGRIVKQFDNFDDLDEILQDYVLHCPNIQHDQIRVYMGYEEKLDPVTRKLVRIYE